MIIDIKKIGINGEGIGYQNRIPVFVNRALIDEKVDVVVTNVFPNYKIAEISSIFKESEERTNPVCKNYSRCDGCSLLHTTYKNQLEIKKELLKEALYKYCDYNLENIEIEESNEQFHYRNCLKLPFYNIQGKLTIGIYKQNSNIICPIDNCLIHSTLLEKLKDEILYILNKYQLKTYDKKTKKGLRYLVLREIGKRAHMCLITGDDILNKELVEELCSIKEIVSIYQNINTSNNSIDIFANKMLHLGKGKHLSFKIDNLKFNLSIKSFFQLNTTQAKKMYRYAVSLLQDNEDLIVEAYSGIGAISLLAKDKAKEIVGIEYVEDAVRNANNNTRLNHIDNVSFICGDTAEVLNNKFRKRSIDALIVDPPRSGLDEEMIKTINNLKIKNIVYISCNPATLAKNINNLKNKYHIKNIKAFDLFPNTAHVETVVLMSRDKE